MSTVGTKGEGYTALSADEPTTPSSAPAAGSSVRERVENCRDKLLDITKRNRLISFKHSEKSNREIRIVNVQPKALYGTLLEERKLAFRALPDEELSPPEERTPEFLMKFEQAELSEDYCKIIEDIENEGRGDAPDLIKRAEQDLKNKVREALGLPPAWEGQSSLSNVEIAKKHGINPNYEAAPLLAQGSGTTGVRELQTLLRPEEMGKKLSGLTKYIRSDIEECGINTLYAAFGFLEWYEAPSSEQALLSPLLLLQLEIEKKSSAKGYKYSVKATGEEPEINRSLEARLRHDFKIQLPEFREEEGLDGYWNKISEWISEFDSKIPKREQWRLRRFITIARLNFSRLVMYEDLDGMDVSGNDIVRKVFLESNVSSGDKQDADYDVDTPEVENTVPLLITSADASQHSALVDVMEGKNLAIKGPPGTGKSQTITNIIACAMAKGKKVLFLAEKMAALDVVHKRLRDAGLDLYCLELHSTKAQKSKVLESIRNRLGAASPSNNHPLFDKRTAELPEKIEAFQRHREKIKEYLKQLHSTEKRSKSIRDYIGLERRARDQIRDPHLVPTLNSQEAFRAESELQDHIDAIDRIVELKKEVDSKVNQGKHPWCFVTNFSLDEDQEGKLKNVLKEWKINLEETQKELNALKGHEQLHIKPSDLIGFLEQTERLAHWSSEALGEELVDRIKNKEEAKSLADFVEGICIYRDKQVKCLEDVRAAVDRTEEIERHLDAANKLGVEECSATDIRAQAEGFKKEATLWAKYLPALKDFDVSKSTHMSRIYAVVEVPAYAASIPRDYLLFRTEKIIDEKNTERLKKAVRTQKDTRDIFTKYEELYDFSILGSPKELRHHAAAIERRGFWYFFDSSYRQARKLFRLASKGKEKFRAAPVAEAFKDIASAQEARQDIEQDAWLQDISESLFKGIDTDIEQLQKINEWALRVRKHYGGVDKFSRKLCQWLLTTKVEELDPFISLEEDPEFILFKERVLNNRDKVPPETPTREYLTSVNDKKKKLEGLSSFLSEGSCREGTTFKEVSEDLVQLKKVRSAKEKAEGNQRIQSLFGERYAGLDTVIQDADQKTASFIQDWCSFSEATDECEMFVDDESPKKWYSFVRKRPELERLHQETKDCMNVFQGLKVASGATLNGGNREWMDVSYAEQVSLLQRALESPNSLRTWIDFHVHLGKFKQSIGGKLIPTNKKEQLDFEKLPEAFKYMVYKAILKEVAPASWRSSGQAPEASCRHIAELDEPIMDLQRNELRNELNKKMPIEGVSKIKKSVNELTERALLNNELAKQKRHIPIRALMRRAGRSIRNIKPCFLMSPLSVATYLSKQFTFDIVVIDEASQMRTEDALGGIVRSKQLVVVGDPKQLPPTSFFSSKGEEEEEEEEDHESIMDMALSAFSPSRTLSRHYRSKHESLIAFSNHQFYEDKLWVFPSPTDQTEELGISRIYVEESDYDSSTNGKEVKVIVEEALRFMKRYRNRSLGIATMNIKQRMLIEGEMERAFENDPEARAYEEKWRGGLEPFFVKNLENVQGDERDTILISTVYGPGPNGHVAQNFGPINKDNGYRRLNVLFTRAKENMVVVTSLKSGNITSETRGAQALKGFLSYTETGKIPRGARTGEAPESYFEEWVKERLEREGYEVHPQVGEGRFRIDLGIKHPKYPHGDYLMGIECDGARYHSSKSARERDIIRQRHLEKLGWNIHRIWSTDWWSDQQREIKKVKEKAEKILGENGVSLAKPEKEELS